jgi:hypothetical protein
MFNIEKAIWSLVLYKHHGIGNLLGKAGLLQILVLALYIGEL